MFSIARSRLMLPAQAIFLLTNVFGLLASIIYNAKSPDYYKGNKHHPLGWAITWIAMAWSLMSLVKLYRRRSAASQLSTRSFSQAAASDYQRFQDAAMNAHRWSHDSGRANDTDHDTLCNSSRSSSMHSETGDLPAPSKFLAQEEDGDEVDVEKTSFLQDDQVDRQYSRNSSRSSSLQIATLFDVAYITLERTILILGFVGVTSGAVVYGGIFRDNELLNGLAHFIKGGIFFGYGILTLGRWTGAFADFGWAWNVKPGSDIVGRGVSRVPSAEFTESFVICLYGASNVFLEHLSSWGGAWTAMDLEHVSITIMFFGGGLLGMLIESSRLRKLLNSAITPPSRAASGSPEWRVPDSYIHSLNPLPALVIMLLGVMMSSHTQHSAVSSAIHKQWGMLFVGFALARGVTYVALYLKPPTSYLASRPPSELIASFCLMSGGIVFMFSSRDTVCALEAYELDAMFVFTIVMGLTCLTMAWVVVCIAIKNWALQREATAASVTPQVSAA